MNKLNFAGQQFGKLTVVSLVPINRAEANDKAARRRKIVTDMDELLPVLKELTSQWKLDFLKGNMNLSNRLDRI
jgi:hypothetical protein